MSSDTTPESLSEFTPTTEEILRGFTAPAYKIEPQRDGESFGEWLGRCSIETMHSQIASEAAARRWLAAHDAEVARKALTGAAHVWAHSAWADVPRIKDQVHERLSTANYVGDWLRARAEQIGEN